MAELTKADMIRKCYPERSNLVIILKNGTKTEGILIDVGENALLLDEKITGGSFTKIVFMDDISTIQARTVGTTYQGWSNGTGWSTSDTAAPVREEPKSIFDFSV